MLSFTKQIAGVFIIGSVLFAACRSSDSGKMPSDQVSLGLHQSARIGADVAVRADSIQDSRCPLDANCIWAGQAKVKLHLSKDTDSKSVGLILEPGASKDPAKRKDSTHVTLAGSAYKVILREVTPYPSRATEGQPQTAVVQVTKL